MLSLKSTRYYIALTFILARSILVVAQEGAPTSNCRVRSTGIGYSSQFEYSRMGNGEIPQGTERQFALDECLNGQLMSIVGFASDPSRLLTLEDHGEIESFPPGQPDKMSRCLYAIKGGQRVSEDLLKFEGVIKRTTPDFERPSTELLTAEARGLVRVECEHLGY